MFNIHCDQRLLHTGSAKTPKLDFLYLHGFVFQGHLSNPPIIFPSLRPNTHKASKMLKYFSKH